MKIVNMTPHVVNIEGFEPFASEGSIRLDQKDVEAGDLNGIPVVIRSYSAGALPPADPNKAFIVSQMVAAAFPERRDFYYPGDLIRNEAGQIVGCKNLCQVTA
jgi:hypothetical protein